MSKKIPSKLLQYLFIYIFSGSFYCIVEILFRGYSHYSMFILAGFIGLIICYQNDNIISYESPFEAQVLFCAAISTLGEYITGLIANQDFYIWDYRGLWGTFANGQLNIFFIFAWIIICAIAIPILDYLEWRFCGGEKPHYRFALIERLKLIIKENKETIKERFYEEEYYEHRSR